MKDYFVYILASHSTDPVLYIGVTNDLLRRIIEHKSKLNEGFTSNYNCDKLVYFEQTSDILTAIEREKQLKMWHRGWKLNLILANNPSLRDLFKDFMDHETLKQVQGDRTAAQARAQSDRSGV